MNGASGLGASEASRCDPKPNDYAEKALDEIHSVALEENGVLLVGEARLVLKVVFTEAMNAAWQASFVAHANRDRILTCAHCGHEFPPGTPTSNHAALTAHGMDCPKSPLVAQRNRLLKGLERIANTRRHDPKCWSGNAARPGGAPFPCDCHVGIARATLAAARGEK